MAIDGATVAGDVLHHSDFAADFGEEVAAGGEQVLADNFKGNELVGARVACQLDFACRSCAQGLDDLVVGNGSNRLGYHGCLLEGSGV